MVTLDLLVLEVSRVLQEKLVKMAQLVLRASVVKLEKEGVMELMERMVRMVPSVKLVAQVRLVSVV
jgi:hypothetical protein